MPDASRATANLCQISLNLPIVTNYVEGYIWRDWSTSPRNDVIERSLFTDENILLNVVREILFYFYMFSEHRWKICVKFNTFHVFQMFT